MSELDRLQEMLGESRIQETNVCIRVRSEKGDTIYGYVKRDPSWLVYEENGLLTYADPCDSIKGKTADYILGYIESDID